MDSKRKKKKIRRNKILIIMILVVIGYVSWILIDQRLRLQELIKEKGELDKKVEQLKELEEQLVKEKEMVNDPMYIERVARERLKMVKPNEIIYIDQERAKFLE